MYHKISEVGEPDRLDRFYRHLDYLCSTFSIVTPGESLSSNRLNICLTFDDAYYDFYYYVYPALQQRNIKAVLGIPTAYIQESTQATPEARLRVPYPDGLSLDAVIQAQTPLCTWPELLEMTKSGYMCPASHSHTHANLAKLGEATDGTHIDWDQEIRGSKTILADKLKTAIDIFIYPYGRLNPQAHREVRKQYRYGMRIGSALNADWAHLQGLLYRVDADALWLPQKPITKTFCLGAYTKYLINRIRGK